MPSLCDIQYEKKTRKLQTKQKLINPEAKKIVNIYSMRKPNIPTYATLVKDWSFCTSIYSDSSLCLKGCLILILEMREDDEKVVEEEDMFSR